LLAERNHRGDQIVLSHLRNLARKRQRFWLGIPLLGLESLALALWSASGKTRSAKIDKKKILLKNPPFILRELRACPEFIEGRTVERLKRLASLPKYESSRSIHRVFQQNRKVTMSFILQRKILK
jgi:hypothetical protein